MKTKAPATRMIALLAWLVLLIAPAAQAAAPQPVPRPLPTVDAFIDAIGVNTHLSYSDSDYNQFSKVLVALDFIGVRHLRDAAPLAGLPNQRAFDRAAQRGFRFTFSVSRRGSIAEYIDGIARFERRNPGSVAAIEGLNEINNAKNFAYAGLPGSAGGIRHQNELYDAVKSRTEISRIPVFNLTGPPLRAKADFVNLHPYLGDGAQPFRGMRRDIALYAAAMPGKPIVFTEGGYHNAVNKRGGVTGVDETTQARLTLIYLFEAIQLGVRRIYLYQLLDAYQDPTRTEMDKHFGLFDHLFRPKPAAVALHNLLEILRSGQGQIVPAAAVPAARISSLDAEVTALQVARPDGSLAIILYRRTRLWDVARRRAFSPAPSAATIDAPGFRAMAIHDPISGTKADRAGTLAGPLRIALGADPVIAILSR